MKFIHPDLETIPEGTERITTHVCVEEPFVEAWLQEIGTVPWKVKVDDCDAFHFDCGGICQQDEPKLELQLDDWKLTVFKRHAETLNEFCDNVQTHLPRLGDHVYLPGYWVKAIVTVETAKAIEKWLTSELPRCVAEADQLWASHNEAMKEAGVYVPPRRSMQEVEDQP